MSAFERKEPGEALTDAILEMRRQRHEFLSRLPILRTVDDAILRERFLALTRTLTRVLNRFPLRELLGWGYGRLGPRVFLLFNRVRETDAFAQNVADYLRLATLWGLFPVEIVSSSASHVELTYSQCPLGIESERKLCKAHMAMEPKLSELPSFSTRITVLECFPEGGNRCRLRFVRK
ncbi:hypothetical protein ACFL59_11885 [Planctomycetota bacterium]